MPAPIVRETRVTGDAVRALASSRLFAWVALLAIGYHAAATVALHALDPAVDPLSDMVGAYLLGDYQRLSRTTFLAFACAFASIGAALAMRLPLAATLRTGVGCAAVASVGFVGVAVAPQAVSYWALPTQLATLVSILLLSLGLRRRSEWRTIGFTLMVVASVLVALFVVTIVLGVVIRAGVGGLANRIVLVLIYTWVLLVVAGLLGWTQTAGHRRT